VTMVLGTLDGKLWFGFVWLRIGTSGGLGSTEVLRATFGYRGLLHNLHSSPNVIRVINSRMR
jgi:hypothetical protein